jgi:hypothetical protein
MDRSRGCSVASWSAALVGAAACGAEGADIPESRVYPARPMLGSTFVRDLQANIAQLADRLGLHATAPVLTLGLLTDVGRLADEALTATSFGRRPFRPTDAWAQRLAEVAFTMINLADQTGVDLEDALRAALTRYQAGSAPAPVADDLPF